MLDGRVETVLLGLLLRPVALALGIKPDALLSKIGLLLDAMKAVEQVLASAGEVIGHQAVPGGCQGSGLLEQANGFQALPAQVPGLGQGEAQQR